MVNLRVDEKLDQVIAWTKDDVPIYLSTDKTDGQGYVVVPCESIILSEKKINTSAANQFKGKIIDVSPGRYGIEVQIDSELPLVAQITKSSVVKMDLTPGREVWASFKAASVRFIRK